jgi:hypothetical protein
MPSPAEPGPRAELLYCFCRLQMPGIDLPADACHRHLERTFLLFGRKQNGAVSWDAYLDNLYPLDWFVASACMEGNARAWEQLFASRAGRSDCLLVDALRARAARLYPRDEERQESAVQEFWSQLYAPEHEGSLPVLARYDGERPLVPWLIRVFQNWHVSQLRKHAHEQPLLDDDHHVLPVPETETDTRWRELFADGVNDWLAERDEDELLLLELGGVVVVVLVSVEVELELEPDVDGAVADGGADGVVLGDAEGVVRSAGRSPTRSVRLSVHAVSRPRLSATAKTAVRNFFISMPSLWGCATFERKCNGHAATRGLTGRRTTFTNATVIAAAQGDAR